jgi:predicted metal-dependent hydrolase
MLAALAVHILDALQIAERRDVMTSAHDYTARDYTGSQAPLVVRKIPFSFLEKAKPHWNSQSPEWCHMVSGASLTMPYLEPFLIKTVLETVPHLKNKDLKEDARGFVGQEGQHFVNHQRYNDMLKENGYTDLAVVEEEMTQDYERLQGKSLKWRLAYTAGFETMTMGITEWLIKDRKALFEGADPMVVSLVLWHMVEETEHKSVAFDLYEDVFGSYDARVFGLFYAAYHVAKFSRRGYVRMMKRDGTWTKLSCRLRLWGMVARFGFNVAPSLLRALWPSYHPNRVTDPAWVGRWSEAYRDLPEDRIPLLDTSDPEIPAQFG